MKARNIFYRAAAALLSAAIIFSAGFADAAAESVSSGDDVILPSGLPVSTIEERIDKFYVSDDADFPFYANFQAAVFQGDRILLTESLSSQGESIAPDTTVYEWGSISKTMIWVSVMQLWEQGKIDLDADIRTYLPDGFLKHLSYDDPVTMLELMNHKGGWCETTYEMQTDDESRLTTLGESLQRLEPDQTYRPGEVFSYSNWGAALAAYIVEQISGMEYSEYVHRNILEPLGMEHTSVTSDFRDNEWVREQREKLQTYKTKVVAFTGIYEQKDDQLQFIYLYPSGSAAGTLLDLARYAQAFVDDTAPLFQNKETQDKLFSGSDFYGDTDIPLVSYGFFPEEEYKVRVYGHDGGTTSCISSMLFDPESKTGVVTLTSEADGNALTGIINDWTFGSAHADGITEEDTVPEKLTGYYLDSRRNAAGILNYTSYFGALNGKELDSVERRSDGLYLISDHLFEKKVYSDGRTGIASGTIEYMQERAFLAKLCLLTAFFMTAAACVFLLLIRRKLRKAGRLGHFPGSRLIAAAQAGKILSAALLIFLFALTVKEDAFGLSTAAGTAVGITHIAVAVLCIIAALAAVYFLIRKKCTRSDIIRYLFCIAGNAVAVISIAYFQMYKFWDC